MAGLIDFFVPPGLQPFLAPNGVPTLPPSPALAGFVGTSNPPVNLPFGDQSADRPVTGLLEDYRRVGLPSPAAQGSAWPEQPRSSPPDALRQWAEAQVARRIHGGPLRSADDRASFDNADTTSSPNAYDPFEAAAARVRNAVSPAGGREEGGMTRLAERLVPAVLRSWATLPQRAFEASERMRLTGEYDPTLFEAASLVAGGPVFGRGTLAPRLAPKPMESKNAGLYNPPPKTARPFEEDYPANKWPHGVPADAAGRLTHDIDGRRLTAEQVVGRRMVGGKDEPLPPSQYDTVTARAIGTGPEAVEARALPRGAVGAYRITPGPQGPERSIGILRGLAPEQAGKVTAHEMGHMIEDLAGKIVGYDSVAPVRAIPQAGIKNQLRSIYNDLNNPQLNQRRLMLGREPDVGKSSVLRNFGPEQFGYSGNAIERELMAEAIRAYMADPNYLKKMAPRTAEVIRAAVNANPRLRDTIQFNSIGGGFIGGGGPTPRSDEGE